MLNVPIPRQSLTVWQYFGAILRAVANYCDGGTIKEPTPREVAREELRAAEIALLAAQTESERAIHTVNMLQERIARLGGVR